MSSSEPAENPLEEELRAAYEAELKRLRVEHVLLDNVAALVNLGMRRTGLVPGTEDERDPEPRCASRSSRSARCCRVLEQAAPAQIGAIRDAVSQLQIAFVQDRRAAGGPRLPEPAPGCRSGGAPAEARAQAPPAGPAAGAPPSPSRPSPANPGRRSAAGGSGCRASSPSGRRADPAWSHGRAIQRPRIATECLGRNYDYAVVIFPDPGSGPPPRATHVPPIRRAGTLHSPRSGPPLAASGGGPFPVCVGCACARPLSNSDLLRRTSLSSFLRTTACSIALVCAGAAVVYGVLTSRALLALSPGNETMRDDLRRGAGGCARVPEPPVHDDRRRRRGPVHRADSDPEHPRGDRVRRSAACSRRRRATSA